MEEMFIPIRERFEAGDTCPVVSVCCIAYNHEESFCDCIESILSQRTNFHVEIIIHDDASTDRTAQVISEYIERFPRIVRAIFQKENQWSKGIKPAWIAFNQCRGQYVAICDADDYWIDNSKLQKQKEILDFNKNVNLCFHSSLLNDFFSRSVSVMNFHYSKERIVNVGDVIKFDGDFMHTGSLFFRKSSLEIIPEEICRLAPVNDYLIQVFLSYPNGAYYINTPMSVYCKRGNGSWTDVVCRNNSKKIEFEKKFVFLLLEMKMYLCNYSNYFGFMIAKHCLIGMYFSVVARDYIAYDFFCNKFNEQETESFSGQREEFQYLSSGYGKFIVRSKYFIKKIMTRSDNF